MSTLIVEVKVDLSNQSQVNEMINFLGKISGNGSTVVKTEEKKEAEPTVKKNTVPAKAKAKEEPVVEKVIQEEDTSAADASAASGSEDPEITFNDVKNMMASKIDDNRDAIKNKMAELGAKNMSTLKEEDYAEFHKFLKSL